MAVHVTSDLVEPASGRVSWRVTTVAGESVASGGIGVRIQPGKSTQCATVRLAKLLRDRNPRDLVVWLALEVAGETVSDNQVLFARPKHMDLERPTISTQVRALSGGAFAVRMKADKPALWTWLELGNTDARYSDNFFALVPGTAKEVTVNPPRR